MIFETKANKLEYDGATWCGVMIGSSLLSQFGEQLKAYVGGVGCVLGCVLGGTHLHTPQRKAFVCTCQVNESVWRFIHIHSSSEQTQRTLLRSLIWLVC